MKILEAVGANIRTYREAASMSQEQLAYLSGIGSAHLGSIERGKSNPTLCTLQKIATGLNVDIQLLMAGTGGGDTETNLIMQRIKQNEEFFRSMSRETQDALSTILSCISGLTGK